MGEGGGMSESAGIVAGELVGTGGGDGVGNSAREAMLCQTWLRLAAGSVRGIGMLSGPCEPGGCLDTLSIGRDMSAPAE